MQALGLSRAMYSAAGRHGSRRIARALINTFAGDGLFHPSEVLRPSQLSNGLIPSPWSTTQLRHARFSGGDVRPGHVIERKGKYYQVVKAHHTTQGRGGAIMQVELRDVDSGNKLNERLRTDEAIERVSVEGKTYQYLYSEDEAVILVDPNTYAQITMPKHLLGESFGYLMDDMKVTVHFCDDRPMSASIPNKVTCKVVEAEVIPKGAHATPQYKKVRLDNGLSIQVPAHVMAGELIIISTLDHTYVSKA